MEIADDDNYVVHEPTPVLPATPLQPPVHQRLWQYVRRLGYFTLVRRALYVAMLLLVLSQCHRDRDVADLAAQYAFPDSRFVQVEGVQVHCRTVGNGPVVLLLHDANSSLHTWAVWQDSLAHAGYRSISIDLPGFGLTGPHPQGSYSVFMYADFLEKLVAQLQLKRFSLVGNGLGGQIAWFYASNHLEQLEQLVLISPQGFEPASRSWAMRLARVPILNRAMQYITPRYFVRLMLEDRYANDALVTEALVERYFALFLRKGNREAFTNRAQVSDNRPPTELVELIETPTLIMWGAEDTAISPKHAYDFHRKMRPADLRLYQNTGHWPQEEIARNSASDVVRFLRGLY